MGDLSWDFRDRAALVTGASRGIGLATAELLAAAGATVVALSRTQPPRGAAAIEWVHGDVTDEGSLHAARDRLLELAGRIDLCVANAGAGLVEDFATTPEADWAHLLDVNLLGVM